MSKRKLKNLVPEDLQAIGDVMGGLLDKQSAVLRRDLASKEDLKDLETNLKDYMHQGFEAVMQGMDNLANRFVEKKDFEKLVEWAKIVGEKVGVKPKI